MILLMNLAMSPIGIDEQSEVKREEKKEQKKQLALNISSFTLASQGSREQRKATQIPINLSKPARATAEICQTFSHEKSESTCHSPKVAYIHHSKLLLRLAKKRVQVLGYLLKAASTVNFHRACTVSKQSVCNRWLKRTPLFLKLIV